MEIVRLSVTDLQKRLREREITPREVIDVLEARIAEVDPALHSYLSRDLEKARAEAATVDVSLPLGGVPIALKDVINVQG